MADAVLADLRVFPIKACLTQDEYDRLSAEAKRRGDSRAGVIRGLINLLPDPEPVLAQEACA